MYRPNKHAILLDFRTPIILYGKGNVGKDVLRVAQANGFVVHCILDRRAQPGEQIADIPVYHPDHMYFSQAELEFPLIIAIFNRDVDVSNLVYELRKKGHTNPIPFWDFHALYPDQLGDRYWLSSRNDYELFKNQIKAVENLWADEKSRILYKDVIRSRLDGNLQLVDQHLNYKEIQYFPSDIPNWLPSEKLRFIDCGAYDGDTIQMLFDLKLLLDMIAAFEPDLENFNLLVKRIQELSKKLTIPCLLWPTAVGEQVQLTPYIFGMSESSKVGENSNGEIALSVGIDSVLLNFHPNMIKMDIEGSEPYGLRGARQIIAEDHPRLAVCVYHCANHIWSIPLFIKEISSQYRFYLRIHAYNGFDLVMYAVSE